MKNEIKQFRFLQGTYCRLLPCVFVLLLLILGSSMKIYATSLEFSSVTLDRSTCQFSYEGASENEYFQLRQGVIDLYIDSGLTSLSFYDQHASQELFVPSASAAPDPASMLMFGTGVFCLAGPALGRKFLQQFRARKQSL